MKALIYRELTSFPSSSQLEYRVERKMGWALIFAYPLICLLLTIVFGSRAFAEEAPSQTIVGIAIGASINLLLCPLLLLLGRLNRFTFMTVNGQQISAQGRGVGSTSFGSGSARIPLAQVQWLGFLGGSYSGLYASRGIAQNICILPGITSAQAEQAITTMIRRFPALQGVEKSQRVMVAETTAPVPPLPPSEAPAPTRIAFPFPPPVILPAPQPQPAARDAGDPAITTIPGTYAVQVEEDAREFRFRIDRDHSKGWLRFVHAGLIAPVLLLSMEPFYGRWPWLLPIGIVLALPFYWFFHVRKKSVETNTLTVTSTFMLAKGDRLKPDWAGYYIRPGQVMVEVNELQSFGFAVGDEDSPSGFVVKSSRSYQCMFPCERKQAIAIAVAIVRKFPEYAQKRSNEL
jgi:hypothetical protein